MSAFLVKARQKKNPGMVVSISQHSCQEVELGGQGVEDHLQLCRIQFKASLRYMKPNLKRKNMIQT